MSLFQLGNFALKSGQISPWKIECDALTPADWEALAFIAKDLLEPFGSVWGVPRGGMPFANALRRYITPSATVALLAEDVITTGHTITSAIDNFSVHQIKADADIRGVCVFCRGACPPWVTPIFQMTQPKVQLVSHDAA